MASRKLGILRPDLDRCRYNLSAHKFSAYRVCVACKASRCRYDPPFVHPRTSNNNTNILKEREKSKRFHGIEHKSILKTHRLRSKQNKDTRRDTGGGKLRPATTEEHLAQGTDTYFGSSQSGYTDTASCMKTYHSRDAGLLARYLRLREPHHLRQIRQNCYIS